MPHRILIADNDKEVRRALETFLHDQLGYLVCTARDGHEALARAQDELIDLCILDAHLTGSSGAETLQNLKTMTPEIEAIVLAHARDFEQTRDAMRFSLPRERVLPKPVTDFKHLTQLIVGILGPPKP